jgi:hypothetical protein
MSQYTYTPGNGNLPYGNRNTNPQGANYGTDSVYSPEETNLIMKEIRKTIFDAAPAQYNALKLLFEKPFIEKGSDEFEYLEKTFGRSPLEANANVGAVAAVPGSAVTQTVTLTATSMKRVAKDLIIIYEDGTHGVVQGIPGATTITVSSLKSQGLPAVTTGQIFAIQSTIESDGMDYFSHYDRLETITRYNYIQFFMRAKRWARVEMQKYINMGTTDYLEHDKQEKLKQLRIDFFNSFFNGVRGEFTISNGYAAKSMGGIYPTMLSAGSAFSNPTVAGLKAAFESLAFQTNYKAEGSTRFIYATDEMLNLFSEIYKQPGLRYEPMNETANLRLKRIELGSMNFVLVPCELFKEKSCFEASWARRILVLDQDSISPVKMKGLPQLEMGETDNRSKGSRENFTDFWVGGHLSLEFNNPVGSFHMLVQ